MKVVFTWDAYAQMLGYVNAAYPDGEDKPTLRESTGWGTVRQLVTGELLVEKVFLMEHEATRVHVDMSTPAAMDGWSKLVQELAETDPEALSHLSMWWHSHPFEGGLVPFSATDTGTMEKFALKDGFLLSVVTNAKGVMSARYDQWSPTRQRLELAVEHEEPKVVVTPEIRAEVLEKVTFPAPKPVTSSAWGNGYAGYKPGGTGSTYLWTQPVGEDPNGKWEVWRVLPTTGMDPYRVKSFKKKKDAETWAAQLSKQNSLDYRVFERGKAPGPARSDWTPLDGAFDDIVDTSYQVWQVGADAPLAEDLAFQAAIDAAEDAQIAADLNMQNVSFYVVEKQEDGTWDAVWWTDDWQEEADAEEAEYRELMQKVAAYDATRQGT